MFGFSTYNVRVENDGQLFERIQTFAVFWQGKLLFRSYI